MFDSIIPSSDVPGLAWPESPGLGLASEGSGLGQGFKYQNVPKAILCYCNA